MVNLAPDILRQRMSLQVICPGPVGGGRCQDYLTGLVADVLKMELLDCFTSDAPKFGPAAWAHITTSGVHMMVWNNYRADPALTFLTVDVYTCQDFSEDLVLEHAMKFFDAHQIALEPVAGRI